MTYECNLGPNRIGKITIKDIRDFKLRLNELTQEFEVSGKDGHVWGAGKSSKGAVISACRCGVQLRDIDLSEAYVPIREVIAVIKS